MLLPAYRQAAESSSADRRCSRRCGADDIYVTERTVDTVISRLRRKIEQDPRDPELILTAWGVGYKFTDAG